MTLDQELRSKLDDIKKVFDLDRVASLKIDDDAVKKYYRVNRIPYSVLYSKTDLIHVGISRDGVFKESDLLEPAKIVGDEIQRTGAKAVLELATGRGPNSYYLAQRFPGVRFDGIDLTEAQLALARKRARKVNNYFPILGDYHDLGAYKDETFDIVFEVEAVCYSTKKEKVSAEAKRVLKKGGLFILFDGYWGQEGKRVTDDDVLARVLFEKGMALQKIEGYGSFLDKAAQVGLVKVREEDLLRDIVPTLQKFEKLGGRFFKHDVLARVVTAFFPKEFTYNAISGYLMRIAIKKGILCYMLTVFQKPS